MIILLCLFAFQIKSLETHVCELRQKCASVEKQTLADAGHKLKDSQKTMVKACLRTAKKNW